MSTDDFKVKLINSSRRAEQVHFDVTPDIDESSNVNYETVDPIHAPGQIMVYKNTNSRTFSISSIQFISRTVNEASLNLQRLWLLRSWTKPIFGQSTVSETQLARRQSFQDNAQSLSGGGPAFTQGNARDFADAADTNQDGVVSAREKRQFFGTELRGKPPAVLLLSAYSRPGSLGNTPEHLNRVPCVIEQLSIPYPSDVDYIHTASGVPMPTLMSLSMTLRETHSPTEYSQFSLFEFKRGTLRNF